MGRNILQHLSALDDWEVIAISRRRPDIEGEYRHIAVDLLNEEDCRDNLSNLREVSHIFFTAYVERPTWTEMVTPNLNMLVNLVEAIEPVATGLRHINLMQGTKWYGNHKNTARHQPRNPTRGICHPTFTMTSNASSLIGKKGKNWTWSSARPHGVCGLAFGNPMNLVIAVAVYATISKALGLPLRHPGSRANAHALYQVTDSGLIARACTWMATEEQCTNEPFNITNGDIFRWEDLWPTLADYFDMEISQPQKINLTQMMSDKGPLWDELTNQYGCSRGSLQKTGQVGIRRFHLHTYVRHYLLHDKSASIRFHRSYGQ